MVDLFIIHGDPTPGMDGMNSDLQHVTYVRLDFPFVQGLDLFRTGLFDFCDRQFRFNDMETESWSNEPLLRGARFQPPLMTRFIQISCHRFQPNPYNLFDQVGFVHKIKRILFCRIAGPLD